MPRASQVAILMTLEGEYYLPSHAKASTVKPVAILMTLEGEYYSLNLYKNFGGWKSQSS